MNRTTHTELLTARDSSLEEKDREILRLRKELQDTEALRDRTAKDADDDLRHVNEVMTQSVSSISHLPDQCPSNICDREYGRLILARKGHPQRGVGQGNWEIRCKCRARLQ